MRRQIKGQFLFPQPPFSLLSSFGKFSGLYLWTDSGGESLQSVSSHSGFLTVSTPFFVDSASAERIHFSARRRQIIPSRRVRNVPKNFP